MNKKNYEDEVINIKVNSFLSLFIFAMIQSLYAVINQFINDEFGIDILLLVSVLLLIILIAMGYLFFLIYIIR